MFFVQHRNIFLAITGIFTAACIGIIVVLGIPFGIDFTGGALNEVSYANAPQKEVLETALEPLDLGVYSLRETIIEGGNSGYVLRTRDLSEAERVLVQTALTSVGEEGQLLRYTSVGPTIGQELKDKAVWAIGAVVLMIVLYVAYAFRGIGQIGKNNVSSWVYGLITILALAHDVIVPAAVFSLLGYFMGAEADVLFIMALLAVLGYSVNDTIVMFDRVRDNLERNQTDAKRLLETHGKEKQAEADAILHEPFEVTVGRATDNALLRSFNTSFTTLLTLGALFYFGGDVTRDFALILLAGVVAGTYSSIAMANPLLVFIASRLPVQEPEKQAVVE